MGHFLGAAGPTRWPGVLRWLDWSGHNAGPAVRRHTGAAVLGCCISQAAQRCPTFAGHLLCTATGAATAIQAYRPLHRVPGRQSGILWNQLLEKEDLDISTLICLTVWPSEVENSLPIISYPTTAHLSTLFSIGPALVIK